MVEIARRGYRWRHQDEMKVLQWNRVHARHARDHFNGSAADLRAMFEDEALERIRDAIKREHINIEVTEDLGEGPSYIRTTAKLVIW